MTESIDSSVIAHGETGIGNRRVQDLLSKLTVDHPSRPKPASDSLRDDARHGFDRRYDHPSNQRERRAPTPVAASTSR
ncbi:MAG: hypothetical protein JO362_10235 [Streptomycetaceae bacterium]|nr:hypothetical protein [Streptomycetaceae bacterium]